MTRLVKTAIEFPVLLIGLCIVCWTLLTPAHAATGGIDPVTVQRCVTWMHSVQDHDVTILHSFDAFVNSGTGRVQWYGHPKAVFQFLQCMSASGQPITNFDD